MSTFNLFPARVPIGIVQQDGTVLMTPEFVRAMRSLFERVGGSDGMSADDLAVLSSMVTQAGAAQAQTIEDVGITMPTDWSGQVASLLDAIDELRQQVQQVDTVRAELAEVRQALEGVELQATFKDPFRVNWERPGAIGSLTPSTGVFTSLSIGGLTVGTADIRTATGATIVAGRTSNTGAGSQPGAYAVYAPNASGTAMIWGQMRVSISNATAGSEASSLIFSTRVAGSFVDAMTLNGSGNLLVGTSTDGMTASGSLAVAQDFAHRGSKLGFYNTAPATKQTITGSRGGNAALASLLTALATTGLITDSSTA